MGTWRKEKEKKKDKEKRMEKRRAKATFKPKLVGLEDYKNCCSKES